MSPNLAGTLLRSADPRPVHFVGIAGAGMNALAELFARQGIAVTGCDLNPAACENLKALGVRIEQGHDAAHAEHCRAIVVSSAVPRSHPELRRAEELNIPVVRRAEALGEAVSTGRLIGIAGTHGKTTTTVMTTMALVSGGLDPSGVVGGRVQAWGGNLRNGKHEVFVVEADEYDRSFLALNPEVAVVTNLEADHLDIYRDLDDIRAAFSQFASRARVVILCGDDRGARTLQTSSSARRVVYSADSTSGSDLIALNLRMVGAGSSFTVRRENEVLGDVQLAVPGLHNVRNALAAIAAGLEFGATVPQMAEGLSAFRGVERRFEIIGEVAGITVVDDYAHHPTEIRATIEAARRVYPGKRIVSAFQPHLFTRTRDFAAEFGEALALSDIVLLTEIYPAREQPIAGVDSGLVQRELEKAGGQLVWRGSRDAVVPALMNQLKAGDVLLTLGAGDITSAAREVFEAIRGKK